jgi:hypothetical protein
LITALAVAILVGGFLVLRLMLRRSSELFCVEVENGRMRVVRGVVPPRLAGDLKDVLGRPPVERARFRVVPDSGHARVEVIGGRLSDAHLQRVRNVLGTWPLARLRSAQSR